MQEIVFKPFEFPTSCDSVLRYLDFGFAVGVLPYGILLLDDPVTHGYGYGFEPAGSLERRQLDRSLLETCAKMGDLWIMNRVTSQAVEGLTYFQADFGALWINHLTLGRLKDSTKYDFRLARFSK